MEIFFTITVKHSCRPASPILTRIPFWYSTPMHTRVIDQVFSILKDEIRAWQEPIVGRVAREDDPFKVLIATMLSLRTKDSTTDEAAMRLFAAAATPQSMARTPAATIERLIYPVGFYKTKARSIIAAARQIAAQGRVPDTMDGLLALPGVGRKTANLVLILGFDKPGICVDTHVHRITNRWGYVNTRTPDETEMTLRKILPRRHWKEINNLLVPYGQNLCLPISPWCSRCRIAEHCARQGVTRSR